MTDQLFGTSGTLFKVTLLATWMQLLIPPKKWLAKNHDPLNETLELADHEGEYKLNSGPLRK